MWAAELHSSIKEEEEERSLEWAIPLSTLIGHPASDAELIMYTQIMGPSAC